MIFSEDDLTRTFDFRDSTASRLVYVPEDTESIADAVTRIGDFGRVIVAAGNYHENLTIQPGTRIVIQAERADHPKLIAARPELPVIQVAPEGSLCLIGLSVHGASSGLMAGSRDTKGLARTLMLHDTIVSDAEYGVYGMVERIHLENSSIERNVYGLAVAGSASLLDTTVADNTFGVLISGDKVPSCSDAAYTDSKNHVFIKNVNVSNNEQGGIAICNAASAILENVYVHKNAYIGVNIRSTPVFSLENLRVGETRLWKGGWGDGLVVVHSSGTVKKSQFSANSRANIIYYGKSGGSIDSNLILYAVFAIYLEGQDGAYPNPAITNNYMYGNQENRVSFGQNLAPTPPPQVPPL